jgi:hypothetical protein
MLSVEMMLETAEDILSLGTLCSGGYIFAVAETFLGGLPRPESEQVAV